MPWRKAVTTTKIQYNVIITGGWPTVCEARSAAASEKPFAGALGKLTDHCGEQQDQIAAP